MKFTLTRYIVAIAAGLMLAATSANAGVRVVNCDEGDSLQQAIDAGGGSAKDVEISVTGVCEENLLITRDRISINGDGNTVIDGQMSVRGADNLAIRDLTITGSGYGIVASVARIWMVDVDLVGNDNDGLALRHGGRINMRNGSVANNHGGVGLLVENGHVQLINVQVSDNDFDGVTVNVNGNLTMIGGSVDLHDQGTGITTNLSASMELEGVSVSHNLNGISVSMGSAVAINNSTIYENADVGISVESGTLGLNNVEVSGSRAGIAASMAKIKLQDARIVNNMERGIDVAQNSALIISGGEVSGNGDVGVVVDEGSSLAANGVGFWENGSSGVSVRWNSNADIVGCAIGNNARVIPWHSGVFVTTSSSVTIDSTEVFGNGTGVSAVRHSFLSLSGATVVGDNTNDGMRLVYDSGARVSNPVVIPENGSGYAVNCRDTESSFENRSPGVGFTNCTGFDLP